VGNPYLNVHRRIRKHQGFRLHTWTPVLAAAVAMPLVADHLLWFLPPEDQTVPLSAWATGLVDVALRLSALIASAVILHSYSDLVRGPDRAVLDVHPLKARALVTAIAIHTFRTRLYLPLMVAVLFSPVAARGEVEAYLGAVGLAFSGWLGGLGVGYLVHLGGVWAAYSSVLSAVLDALRGDNPRMQAALIYAPGVALGIVGLSLGFAAMGLEAALGGWTFGWLWLAIPAVVGFLSWLFVGRLAEKFYIRATLLLAEVDGAWGSRETPEISLEVYLEKFGRGRPELLRALRHGWRNLRTFATGGWILGLLSAALCWSDVSRAPMVGAGSVVLIAGVAARMAEGDPLWLDKALGVSVARVATARFLVALMYTGGVLTPLGLVLAVRHGMSGFLMLSGLAVLTLLVSAAAAAVARQWRERATWAYGTLALVAWAGFVRVIG